MEEAVAAPSASTLAIAGALQTCPVRAERSADPLATSGQLRRPNDTVSVSDSRVVDSKAAGLADNLPSV